MNFRKCYFNICLFFSVDSSSWVFKKTQKTWESGLSLKLDEKAWERNSRNTEVTADAKNILINLRLWIAFNTLGPHPYFSLITADWESTNWSCGLGTASEGTGCRSQADLMRSDWIGGKGEKCGAWKWVQTACGAGGIYQCMRYGPAPEIQINYLQLLDTIQVLRKGLEDANIYFAKELLISFHRSALMDATYRAELKFRF